MGGSGDHNCAGASMGLCYGKTTDCRVASKTGKTTFATTGTNAWKSTTDAECLTLVASPIAKCRDATTGAPTTIGKLSWKSATDAECTAALADTECRCPNGVKATGDSVDKADDAKRACKDPVKACQTTLTLAAGFCRRAIAGLA